MIFKLPPKSKALFRTSKHIETNIFEGFWMQFQAYDMICIPHFTWQISWFWPKYRLKRYYHIHPKWGKKGFFRWFFKLSPKSKILFGVSKLIEWDIFEGFCMRFEAQKVIFTCILDAGDQWIMAKIRFYTSFPITPKKAKNDVFWWFF